MGTAGVSSSNSEADVLSFRTDGFLLTDSLIGLIAAVVIVELCALTVRIRLNQSVIITNKIRESEERYEEIIRGIPTCVIVSAEADGETGDSCSNSF